MKKGLKITLWVVAAILFYLFIFPFIAKVFVPKTNESNTKQEQSVNVDQKNKLKELMAEEPSVKDYVLTDSKVLYVSVIDDGSRREGLASYFCQHMKDNNITIDRVKIVKFGSQNHPNRDNSYGILLGESWCK